MEIEHSTLVEVVNRSGPEKRQAGGGLGKEGRCIKQGRWYDQHGGLQMSADLSEGRPLVLHCS